MAVTKKAEKTYHVAFDCGNSSFRTVLGTYDQRTLQVEVIDQIPNNPIDIDGYLHWDIRRIFSGLQEGLKKAYERNGRIDTVGVTTWGIDFALLDEQDELVADPLCYRNTLGVEVLNGLDDQQKLFNWENSGIQNHPMNSLYQLMGLRSKLPERYRAGRSLLFIPDLLIFLFTGVKATERSIASTSQMYNVMKGSYSEEILERYDISPGLLSPIVEHGSCVGLLKESLAEELGIEPCPFICTPSHDTASAVTALPTSETDQLFISSGTWSLVGAELTYPIISPSAADCRFANEAGVHDTITFLKNSTGLYLLQEMKKYLESSGLSMSWDEISEAARSKGMDVPLIDPNHPEIFSTRDMFKTLSRLTGSDDFEILLASCYVSLALCYQKTIEDLQNVTVKEFSDIFIIGGGCRDSYVNQLTADMTGRTVHTGPVEAASIGNLALQLTYIHPGLTLSDIREVVIRSTEDERAVYDPKALDPDLRDRKIHEFAQVTHG